jgi:hypothetical protein
MCYRYSFPKIPPRYRKLSAAGQPCHVTRGGAGQVAVQHEVSTAHPFSLWHHGDISFPKGESTKQQNWQFHAYSPCVYPLKISLCLLPKLYVFSHFYFLHNISIETLTLTAILYRVICILRIFSLMNRSNALFYKKRKFKKLEKNLLCNYFSNIRGLVS